MKMSIEKAWKIKMLFGQRRHVLRGERERERGGGGGGGRESVCARACIFCHGVYS